MFYDEYVRILKRDYGAVFIRRNQWMLNSFDGKAERWKPIRQFECQYEVSSWGRIRSVSRMVHRPNSTSFWMVGILRRTPLNVNGYPAVSLRLNGRLKTFVVYRFVAEAFIPNCDPSKHVNHKDGVKTNTSAINLEWVTRSENVRHAISNGLLVHARGEMNSNAKLTEAKVLEIRRLYSTGVKVSIITKIFKLDYTTIRKVAKRLSWAHV